MLNRNDYTLIGELGKPHGISGQINSSFHSTIFNEIDVPEFLFVEIDGYLIPFKVEKLRLTMDDSGFIKFEDIDNDAEAKKHANLPIYIENSEILEVEDLEFTADQLVGFNLLEVAKGSIGEITDYIDNPMNPLLIIETKAGDEVMIPFAMDLIKDIAIDDKTITMELPDGLLDLEQ